MRTFPLIVFLLAFIETGAATNPGKLIEVAAAPKKGFNFPYVLFLPKRIGKDLPQYLMIEPNNTGTVNDNLDVHRAAAIRTAKESGVGTDVASQLGLPLLVPVFPRPKSMENVYTHALDRDTILIRDGSLRRIDLQLMAMADDARHRLTNLGRPVNPRILINGFSASGTFANRFTFLHPQMVAAAAYGGLNGFIMVPVSEMQSQRLEFPLGLADYQKITGHPFDRASYSRIPQFAYMGDRDDNDAVLYDDAYPEPERTIIFTLFGRKMMPDRWQAVQTVYREQNLPVQFKTYVGYGHGTDGKINGEVAEFFRNAIQGSSGTPKEAGRGMDPGPPILVRND